TTVSTPTTIANAISSGLKLEINEFTLFSGSEEDDRIKDGDIDQRFGEPIPRLVQVDEFHVTMVCEAFRQDERYRINSDSPGHRLDEFPVRRRSKADHRLERREKFCRRRAKEDPAEADQLEHGEHRDDLDQARASGYRKKCVHAQHPIEHQQEPVKEAPK